MQLDRIAIAILDGPDDAACLDVPEDPKTSTSLIALRVSLFTTKSEARLAVVLVKVGVLTSIVGGSSAVPEVSCLATREQTLSCGRKPHNTNND